MTAKLCDFGLSCIQRKKSFRDDGDAPGSPLWMSPEVLLGGDVNETADIYAYAIVFWELLTEEDPFSEYDDLEPFINAVCFDGERPHLPENIHSNLKVLLGNCWNEDVTVRPGASNISSMLDEILLEVCLDEESAKVMWRTNFAGKAEISFGRFAQAFYGHISIDYPQHPEFDEAHKCLSAMLPGETVTINQFGDFLIWFGPFNHTILDRLVALLKEPWFFGDISKDEAEAKLSDFEKKGTFLIRLSTNDPRSEPFTLSLIRKQIMHLRIKKTPDGLRILFKKASKTVKVNEPDLSSLLKTIKTPLALGKPCLGRKYKDIFSKKAGAYLVTNYEDDEDE